MTLLSNILRFLSGDAQADRVVPPTGFTAQLTVFAAGAMALSSVSVLTNALRLRRIKATMSEQDPPHDAETKFATQPAE